MNRLKEFSRFFSVVFVVVSLLTMDTARDLLQHPDVPPSVGLAPERTPVFHERVSDEPDIPGSLSVLESVAIFQEFVSDDELGFVEPAPDILLQDDDMSLVFPPYLSQRSNLPSAVSVNVPSNSGFFLWDLLDGIAGITRSFINAVGRFFLSLFQIIGEAVNAILNGLKWLFIPSRQSFATFRDDILQSFDKKFGSVFSALNYLNMRFSDLRARNMQNEFVSVFPQGSFLYGMKINFLAGGMGILGWARFVITGTICLVTFLICFHKVTSMVEK